MGRVKKDSLVNRVSDAVRGDLAKGRWEGFMPGLRELARVYGVSVPTVRESLGILVEEQLLEMGGAKRRTIILDQGKAKVVRAEKRRRPVVLIVARRELHKMGTTGRRVIHEFERLMVKGGWDVEFKAFNYFDAKKPRKSWDEVMMECDPYCIVTLVGRPVLGEWAFKHGRKIAFCGGWTTHAEVPVVAVSASQMVTTALKALFSKGHRRIVYPMADMCERTREVLEVVMTRCFGEQGITFSSSVHMPVVPLWDQEEYEEMLIKMIDGGMPDAVLCATENEVSALLGVLMRKGLKVGEDLAVVLMGEIDGLEWFRPRIASFEYPQSRLTAGLVRICESWLQGKQAREGELKASLVEGESMGCGGAGR